MANSKRICAVEGCGNPPWARGWCSRHYQRWRNTGDPTECVQFHDNSGPCSVDGCEGAAFSRGWCARHYSRWSKHGPEGLGDPERNKPLKWLLDHIHAAKDDCLIFPFGRTGLGYGALYPKGEKQVLAHRWVCEKVHGPAPAGKIWVAHSCANGHLGCVNPKHLRWATPKENGEDRVAHGNAPRGPAHGNAKLSASDALAIYTLKGLVSYREASRRFGVTNGAVSAIWNGRAWVWLTGETRPA